MKADSLITRRESHFPKHGNHHLRVSDKSRPTPGSAIRRLLCLLIFLAASFAGKISAYQQLMDFGDAPKPYPTLLADDGARHAIKNQLYLGLFADAEPDGQPSVMADGDDLNGSPSDEDGVAFLNPLLPGGMANLKILVTGSGKLDAWVDFNHNGVWERSEAIFSSFPVSNGFNYVSFPVPPTAGPGSTYARFRLSSAGGLAPTGFAEDGEVEDYRVDIASPENQNPVLSVSKSVLPNTPVGSGDNLVFNLGYTNLGPGNAVNCLLVDALPPGFSVSTVNVTPARPYLFTGSTLYVDAGNMAPGDNGLVVVSGTGATLGSWTNSVVFSATNAPAVNASATFAVLPPEDPNFPTNNPPFNFSLNFISFRCD